MRRRILSFFFAIVRWYGQAIAKYFVFSGRASGKELWSFIAINTAAFYALGQMIQDRTLFFDAVEYFNFFLLLPSLTVIVRRTHDLNVRAWWLLLWIITPLLLFLGSCWLESYMFPLPSDVDPEMLDEPFCVYPLLTIMFVFPLILLAFVVFISLPGSLGANRFGPDPRKATEKHPTNNNASPPFP